MAALVRRLAAFALAGGTGFVVDAGLTEALVAFGLSAYLARILAVAAAMSVTYAINRRLTFGDRGGTTAGRPARYVAVSLFATAVNYLVFAAVIALAAGLRPVFAVAAGTAVGMVINYIGYSRLVFPAAPDQAA